MCGCCSVLGGLCLQLRVAARTASDDPSSWVSSPRSCLRLHITSKYVLFSYLYLLLSSPTISSPTQLLQLYIFSSLSYCLFSTLIFSSRHCAGDGQRHALRCDPDLRMAGDWIWGPCVLCCGQDHHIHVCTAPNLFLVQQGKRTV